MIIHNPKISGSLQFPSDENGNLISLQVQNGTLETVTLNSSGVDQNVQPSVNYSGSFTGSFVGDGSSLTGVSAINIDALSSLGGATVAQGDNLVVSDAGTEKKVTFSNLEDSVFGNVSGDITIAAGGAATLASIANSKLANSSITIDGSAISLGGSVTTTNTQLSTEAVQDIAGALVATGGTKTGIAVTYDDDNANMDFVVTFPSQTDENFTTADHDKLDGIEASADVTDATNVTAAGALMDSELTDLAGVKGVTISTLQPKPSEGAFENGDKTKLDGIAASANNYVLPTNLAGDDVDIDTTALSGATVISDLDLNITTNTSGLVTDANGSISTRDLTPSDLGLGNVDNTSDANKPVSTAQQTEIDTKADLASPSLTGNPTAPTQADNDDSTKIATTAYVQREVSDLLGGAPAAFDTLLEISASIANGDSDVVALTTTVGTKLAKSSNLSDLSNASTARTNLGVAIGSDVQAFNSTLGTVAGGTYSGDNSIVTIGTVTTGDVKAILPSGVVSGSDQVNALASDVNNNTITFTAGAGLDGGGAITLNQSSDETVTFTVSDGVISGSSQVSGITNTQLAGSIANSKLSNSSITIDGSAISLGGSVTTLQLGTSSSTALAGNTTTISGGQASAITANTAKNTNVSTDLSKTTAADQITINSSDGDNVVIGEATGTIAGLMSTTHHDKLDGIEASADVTDTTNVTSAGALMDSEVTNLADVKSFDTSDYATSAQGTKADAALPKGGGAMTGAITTNSTFDGRDVATDGTKLDTIESSADVTDTANVTSAGALMDSELTSITDVKALDQSVVSGATPTFTVTNFSDVSNKRFMSDAQETKLDSVESSADVTDTANVKSSLNASLGGAANIGDGSDTITIPGDLVVTGTTTTENVTTLTTSNGIVFEGSVADEHEATLKAGTLSADRTLTLPNATGTIALTSDLASVGDGGLTQNNFTNTLKSKLDGIEGSADVTDATNVTSAGALMDSEVTDLAGIKGVTISTLQVKPSEGAFENGDKTKLDAIEASADVTDTTNVTSAGALMDSEVTNLSQVKSFDSSDYATASQGSKADSAQQPPSEGAFANGDKTKLDGIEASADVTDATNVTSAGALMDSEVSNLSLVKGLTKGISDGNVLTANDAVADDDFLRINGTEVEGLSVSEVRTALNVESGADVTDTTNVTSAGALMDSELTDLAGVKGVTISTLQVKPSEGAFENGDKTKLDGIASSANNYVLPTNLAGDDIDIDTTALSGATVISDLDINITTDTSGRVTDANGSVGTRTLTLANLGYTGDTDATDDQTAAEIRSLVGTGNGNFVPSAGSSGQFLKHDGTFGTPSYIANTDVDVSVANLKTRLGSSFASNAVSIGDSNDTVTIPGDLVVTGTTTTNNVETVSTSNGVVFEGSAADANEGTLLAGTLSGDRTYTLPNATGTVALTSDIPTSNSSLTNGENYISSFDITTQTDSKYLRSNANDTATGIISITNTTASTSKTTGALKVTGGVGISGALNVGGDVVAFASSDERLKDNIELISNPIEKVQSLKGVTWNWNDNADELQQSLPNVGVIAQDVEKVLPQLVTNRDNGYKGVDYAKLTGLLIEAVKDQQKQIDELKSKLS